MATITGTNLADTIRPGTISAGVTGASGPTDPLNGNDLIDGGAGNDTIQGGAGVDTLRGGVDNDTAIFAVGDNVAGESFNGGTGTDTADFRTNAVTSINLIGLTAVESVVLFNGTTTIGAGQFTGLAATLTALNNGYALVGANAGTYDFSTMIFNTVGYQGFTGSGGNDSIVGNAQDTFFNGGTGNDSIDAGAGNDTLVGGTGTDTLVGGAGNDIAVFTDAEISAGDIFDGGGDNDTADFRSNAVSLINGLTLLNVETALLRNGNTQIGAGQFTGAITTLTAANNAYTLSGAAAGTYDFSTITFNLVGFNGFTGSTGNDTILGNGQNNLLNGGTGNDSVNAGAGNDTLVGGTGTDTLLGGTGDDIAVFTDAEISAGDVFDGGADNDTADFRSNAVSFINGLTLLNVETALLRNGNTQIGAGQFTGAITTLTAANNAYSLSGADAGTYDLSTITFNTVGYQGFTGSAGNDSITGNAQNTFLSGGGGNDTVDGGDGNDTLAGGTGLDTLRGGQGDDVVVFGLTDVGAGESFVGGLGLDTADFRSNAVADVTGTSLSGVETIALRNGNTAIGAGQFNGLTTAFTAFNNSYSLSGSNAGNYNFSTITFNTIGFGGFTGSTGNDTIVGNIQDSFFSGGTGNDSIDAGDGNDVLVGGTGTDTLRGGAGIDTFIFTTAEVSDGDIVDGGADGDTVDFRANNVAFIDGITLLNVETVALRNGNTEIAAGQFTGAVTLLTALNNAYSISGTDAGTYDLSTVTFNTIGFGGFTGSIGNDTILGNAQGTFFSGGAGNDSIDAGAGNDVLVGGTGTDTLRGGAGIDTFFFTVADVSAGDIVDGGADGDTVDFRTNGVGNLSGIVFTGIETFTLRNGDTAIAAGQFTGVTGLLTALNNSYSLSAANAGVFDLSTVTVNTIGFGGFTGSAAADLILGNAQGTILNGGSGVDVFFGGAGNDTISGGAGRDIALYLGAAADFSVVVSGPNRIVTDLRSGAPEGVDTVNVETIRFVNGDLLRAGNGGENLVGGNQNDVLIGGNGPDTLNGGNRDDVLLGEGGNDSLVGGTGNDNLYAGGGANTLSGGADKDTFFFDDGALGGAQTVTDFEAALREKLDVSGIDADTTLAGDQAFRFIRDDAFGNDAAELRFEVQGADVLVQGDVDGDGAADLSILVLNQVEALASWFVR